MGLLSDPEYGSAKWVRILKKVHGPLSFLSYIGALVWFLLFGLREFNNETYFSENALLPGLVTNEFNGDITAKHFLSEFLVELEDKYDDNNEMPVPWLVGQMSQLHLEVYTHNFTLEYPFVKGQIYKGTNVYGILRAARTPSLEALVVSVPYRPPSSFEKNTVSGIALMLAFAHFARPQKYWAKDIIFLVTEHEQLGMQAWLEAYHGLQSDTQTFYSSLGSFWKPSTPGKKFIDKMSSDFGWTSNHKKCLNHGQLRGRSGSIQAAINLEIPYPSTVKYIEVKVEGLNGQLPNLDLVNTVHKLCGKAGIHHSYRNSYSWIRHRNKMDDWTNSLWTMLGMVSAQFAGVPNGNHGLFHRFGIEAVTLEGRGSEDGAPGARTLPVVSLHRLGTALEAILRSLNNLLERFHQSYFFYLLAATNRFISIGQYMPSLCLLCFGMLLKALALWVTIKQDDEIDDTHTDKHKRKNSESEVPGEQKHENVEKEGLRRRKKESDEKGQGDEEEETVEIKKKEKSVKHTKTEDSNMSIVNIGANYLLVHLIGYGVMNSPPLLTYLGTKYFKANSEVSVFYGLIAISVALVFITPFLPRLLRSSPISRQEMALVNILALVELTTLCLTVGMHNFPLGLVTAVVYTPLALVVGVVYKGGGFGRRCGVWVRRVVCAGTHPMCVSWACTLAAGRALYADESWRGSVSRATTAHMQALMFAVVDTRIYGNWLFNIATAVLLPTWLIFWQIACNRVYERRNLRLPSN